MRAADGSPRGAGGIGQAGRRGVWGLGSAGRSQGFQSCGRWGVGNVVAVVWGRCRPSGLMTAQCATYTHAPTPEGRFIHIHDSRLTNHAAQTRACLCNRLRSPTCAPRHRMHRPARQHWRWRRRRAWRASWRRCGRRRRARMRATCGQRRVCGWVGGGGAREGPGSSRVGWDGVVQAG